MSRLSELLEIGAKRAREMQLPYAGALTPQEAYEVLQMVPAARLVDVRTKAEWDWVGRVPGALEIEWFGYPGSVPNTEFVAQVQNATTSDAPVMFMCRSGVRSSNAAKAVAEAGHQACYNVLGGFEGDKDGENHRNKLNGWRVAGLPWTQS